jgi:mgtE-like transporter
VTATTVVSFVLVPVAAILVVRSGRSGLVTIIRESLPVLVVGILLDLVAGVTVEGQLVSFAIFPALLVLLPAFLALSGALGGTLSSRLSTQLHLGMITPTRFPEGGAREDVVSSLVLAFPIFGICGLLSHGLAVASNLASPGVLWMIASAMVAGIIATGLASLVAYYSTIASVRAGLDPDTYGIPLVTSTLDVLGAFTFILAVKILGFT